MFAEVSTRKDNSIRTKN